MITIFTLVGESFLQTGCQGIALPSLGLGQTLHDLFQFPGVRNLLTGGQSEQVGKAGVNPYLAIGEMRNFVRRGVDHQAEIPARRPLDDAPSLDLAIRQCLRVEADTAEAWHRDIVPLWPVKGIREGNAVQFVALPLEFRALRLLFETALPCRIRGREHALQSMAGNAQRLTVVGKEIVKCLRAVVDAVLGIKLQLADSPIPDSGEVPEPVRELVLLWGRQSKFELALDHATPVSAARCIAE